jgi:hypothetical protein
MTPMPLDAKNLPDRHQQAERRNISEILRLGVSADDELLLQMQLDFDPRSAALSRLIPGTGAFTNQAFESERPSPF